MALPATIANVLASRKVVATIGTLTGAWFTLHYEAATLPPTQRCAAIIAFQLACAALIREVIASWSAEAVADAAASLPVPAAAAAQAMPGPTQVNVGLGDTNVQNTKAPSGAKPVSLHFDQAGTAADREVPVKIANQSPKNPYVP